MKLQQRKRRKSVWGYLTKIYVFWHITFHFGQRLKVERRYSSLDQTLPHSGFGSQKMLVWPFLTRLIISIMPKMVAPPAQLSHPYIVFVHNWCFISLNDPNQPEIDPTALLGLQRVRQSSIVGPCDHVVGGDLNDSPSRHHTVGAVRIHWEDWTNTSEIMSYIVFHFSMHKHRSLTHVKPGQYKFWSCPPIIATPSNYLRGLPLMYH